MPNKPQSDKAIAAEVALLKQQRPRVPQNAFGDDNQAAIAAQIKTLEEKLSEGQIYERYDNPEDGETLSDAEQHSLDAALEAIHWAEGTELHPPSYGWAPLVGRNIKPIAPPR